MKFLKRYYEWFLISSGLVLGGLLLWAVIWGVMSLGLALNRGFGNIAPGGNSVNFNLDKAAQLDFRGLNQ